MDTSGDFSGCSWGLCRSSWVLCWHSLGSPWNLLRLLLGLCLHRLTLKTSKRIVFTVLLFYCFTTVCCFIVLPFCCFPSVSSRNLRMAEKSTFRFVIFVVPSPIPPALLPRSPPSLPAFPPPPPLKSQPCTHNYWHPSSDPRR